MGKTKERILDEWKQFQQEIARKCEEEGYTHLQALREYAFEYDNKSSIVAVVERDVDDDDNLIGSGKMSKTLWHFLKSVPQESLVLLDFVYQEWNYSPDECDMMTFLCLDENFGHLKGGFEELRNL